MRIDYDRMADVFDSTRSYAPGLIESVALGVSTIASKGDRVLDIGTGTGRFLTALREAGIDAYGLDISGAMLRKARAKGMDALVRADATNLPFSDRSFKASLITNVIHLVPAWKELMQEACRVSARAVISFDIGRGDDDYILAFKRIMEERGIRQPRAGPLESELAGECRPECRVDLGGYEERKGRDEVLSAFEIKTFTFQSELTDEENRICMDEFKKRFRNDPIVWKNSVTMIVWDPTKLRDDLQRTTFSYPHTRTF